MAAEADAHRRVWQTARAACRYRVRHGQLPDRPQDLTPEFLLVLLTDPFDGKPLRWARTGKNLAIYSIGDDGKDDGGRPSDRESRTGDIVFRVPQ